MTSKYQVDLVKDEQIHQGDIFKQVPYYESYKEASNRFELSLLRFPYTIVLTQECDLKNYTKERKVIPSEPHDIIKHDKYLISSLCAPLYNAQHLFDGNHLEKLNIESERKNSNQRNYIKSNRDPRYHYIEFEDSIQLVPMIIDFKHYFTITLHYLETNLAERVCSIKPIFRESITQRFSNFLSRIGLPESKKTEL
jgi:hypothetical protein